MLDRTNQPGPSRSRITAEAKQVFARIMALQPVYDGCIRGENCSSPALNEHCAACRDYLECARELDRLLDLPPWEASPTRVDDPDPPEAIAGDSLKAADWRKAWALRCELQEP